jgi:hypothetical protein
VAKITGKSVFSVKITGKKGLFLPKNFSNFFEKTGFSKKRPYITSGLMAIPEKKVAKFRFSCGHQVAQQPGNWIDSTRVDPKIKK